MPRAYLAIDVFAAAYDRYRKHYDRGDRVVISCSGGKDSIVCVELAIMAARDAGRLPVEVVMRDEEIMLPGTFEYCERLANRTDVVDFHWVIAGQPIVNIFNRYNPYFWVFDQTVDPDRWVRKYPGFDADTPALIGRQPYWIPTQHIGGMSDVWRFPPAWPEEEMAQYFHEDGSWITERDPTWASRGPDVRRTFLQDQFQNVMTAEGVLAPYPKGSLPGPKPITVTVMGLRTSESPRRMMGLMSKRGPLTLSPNQYGVWELCPIYDWQDGDVWKFIKDFDLDYNHAYDAMRRLGVPRQRLRIAPPTLTSAGLSQLQAASRAWPQWFDRVAARLEGVRTAVQFGKRAISPYRRLGETWEQCFYREVIDPPQVPEWLRERALEVRDMVLKAHSSHAGTANLPDVAVCPGCYHIRCWRDLAAIMYNGDPFAMKAPMLQPIEPEFFREGAGTWGGAVAFT